MPTLCTILLAAALFLPSVASARDTSFWPDFTGSKGLQTARDNHRQTIDTHEKELSSLLLWLILATLGLPVGIWLGARALQQSRHGPAALPPPNPPIQP